MFCDCFSVCWAFLIWYVGVQQFSVTVWVSCTLRNYAKVGPVQKVQTLVLWIEIFMLIWDFMCWSGGDFRCLPEPVLDAFPVFFFLMTNLTSP